MVVPGTVNTPVCVTVPPVGTVNEPTLNVPPVCNVSVGNTTAALLKIKSKFCNAVNEVKLVGNAAVLAVLYTPTLRKLPTSALLEPKAAGECIGLRI